MARAVSECASCGGHATAEPADVPMRALPTVVLVGVQRIRCGECGATAVDIPDLQGLIRAVALALVGKPSRLTGRELRLLRNHLGWSSEESARRLGVTPETMSRWENERQTVNAVADRFARSLVLLQEGMPVPAALLDRELPTPAEPLEARARHNQRGWEIEASTEQVRRAIDDAARILRDPHH